MRVEVEHFACIRRAAVDLGPGLNVLFGPNDLGKSTLARAVRAALLLPHASSMAQEFVEWDSDETPFVKLTLELQDRRIWRIEKRFGSGGSSVLRESTDGLAFSPYKRAREVDDEVRTMLGWGIASPATKGAPRGLPTSFLAQVLLGEQTDVTAILRQTLEQDTDGSGRERLTTALAAFAQDPLFKSILEEAQGKVDLAFTATTGQKKRGKTSPFREVTDEVKRVKEEVERLGKRVDESENARRELEACNAELLRSHEARVDAVERRDALRRATAQLEIRRSIDAELSLARQVLAEQQKQIEELREKEALLQQTRKAVNEAKKGQQDLASARDELSAKEKTVEEALRRARSDEAEQARQLRRSELEKCDLELSADLRALEAERVKVTKARSIHGDLETARARAAELTEARERTERAADAAANKQQEIELQLELSDVAARLEQRRRLESSINELDQVRAEVDADRASAGEHRARGRELLDGILPDLPDETSVAAMKQLAHELDVAEAKLGGGLAVVVERLEPVGVRATADGSELDVPTNGPVIFEVTRGFVLQIGETARVTVTAGEKEARENEAGLRRQWEEEVKPVLERLGASELAFLVKRVDEAERVKKKAHEIAMAAAGLEQRASARAEQLAKLPSLTQELSAIDRELAGESVDAAREMLDALGNSSLDEHRTRLKQQRAGAQETRESARKALVDAETEAKVLAERIGTSESGIAELDVAEPDNGWDELEALLAERAEKLRQEKETISGELQALAAEQDVEVQTAEAEQVKVREALAATTAKLEESTQGMESLRDKASRLEGEVENRRAAVAKLDFETTKTRVDEITARLVKLPIPTEEVTEEAVRQVEVDVEEADGAYERAHDATRKAEGALQTVGGQVVLEEQAVARDALRQAERKEHEVELEYDAWRLLVDKLREAENTDGQHLGEALSQPVSERFAVLTANRYGKLEVAPNLQAGGLRVAGVLREVSALSVGTQEQLAALLRLTVAEHLQSTLVLDDHLTQTDPARSAWFRDVLRDHGSKTQVIVLTCRPEDYLRKEDLPTDGETMTSRAGGLVRALDLTQLLERGGSGPAEKKEQNEAPGSF